jgi:N-acetylglucosaminyldiphosphoundecaprenol N-acetyl-beta-D-mannosaminyltransferase
VDPSRRIEILGTGVDPVTLEEAVIICAGFAESGAPHVVITVNPEAVENARRDAEFARVLREADLLVADGAGIVWASRRLGMPVPERVAGIDLLLRLSAVAASHGYGVYLLGARPGVASNAAHALAAQYPGLRIAGTMHGYFQPSEEAGVLAGIRRASPHVLFVGTGSPRQEKWMARHREALNVPVAMGVGGSFDVLSGEVRRAPLWMRSSGLEWLYRLGTQPARWRRSLSLAAFALRVIMTGQRRVRT